VPPGVVEQCPFGFLQPAPSGGFPQTPPISAQANLWGTDDTLKTPHAYAVDFSIGRELPKRFSLQFSYVGRFGRDLLTQRDLNQPLDIVDPKTGIDYYTAAAALSNLARKFALANNNGQPTNFYNSVITTAQISSVTAAMLGPTAQYWVDMLPALRPGAARYVDTFTNTPTSTNVTDSLLESVFDLYYNPLNSVIGDEIVGLFDIDSAGGLGDNIGGVPRWCTSDAARFWRALGKYDRGTKEFSFLRDSVLVRNCLLYTSPSPRDLSTSRMPSSA